MSQDIAKLTRELQFIEESFRSGIISRQEYEAAKKRVEDKLSSLRSEEEETERTGFGLLKGKYDGEEASKEAEKENKEKDQKLEVYYESDAEKGEEKSLGEERDRAREAQKEEEKKEETKIKREEQPKIKLQTYGRKFSFRHWIIISAIILLVLILIVSINQPAKLGEKAEKFIPVCTTDIECQKPGYIGTCLSPSTKEANCSYELETPINITIITSKKCALCDIDRMRNTLSLLYQGASFSVIDSEDELAKELISKFNIDVLPAYIFDRSVEETKRFLSNTSSTKETMIKRGNYYMLTPLAAGSTYFFKNDEDKNRAMLFIDPYSSTSHQAFKNLVELKKKRLFEINIKYYLRQADGLKDKKEIARELCIRKNSEKKLIDYLKCLNGDISEENSVKCMEQEIISQSEAEGCITEDGEDLLEKDNELAGKFHINTLPVFIFNNQYKKGGSLSVDILEDAYCKVNGC
jgi:hypothetical protein